MEPQFTAILAPPVLVQIEHAGKPAAAVATKLVEVFPVEGTLWVAREMAFELEQPELQLAVERQSQRLEARKTAALWHSRICFVQPVNLVGSNVAAGLPAGPAADRRDTQHTFRNEPA